MDVAGQGDLICDWLPVLRRYERGAGSHQSWFVVSRDFLLAMPVLAILTAHMVGKQIDSHRIRIQRERELSLKSSPSTCQMV
jgi:hypothetical protein